jgi:hypothetical protein
MKIVRLLLVLVIIVASTVGCGGGGGGGNPGGSGNPGDGGGDTPITGEPVWNAAIGYITESTSSSSSSTSWIAASMNATMNSFNIKEMIAHESFAVPTRPVSQSMVYKAAGTASSSINLDNCIKFIYLDWAPLTGATYYKVYFKGEDGTENKEVWDSRSIHSGDPQYLTIAYLDFSDELNGVSCPGKYKFQTIAYNNSSSKEYPVVTASIGTKLTSLPTGLDGKTPPKLTWTALSDASEYKVGIYQDSLLRNKVGDSGTTLNTTFDYSSLGLADGLYYWAVYACSVDSSNKVVEITFTVSSFEKR